MNRRETSNALMREVVGYAERTGRRPERWAVTGKTWDALQEELRGANSLYTPWGVVWLVKDCECGASAHHEPTPGGCTPPARAVATLQDVADAINRGDLPGIQGQARVRDGVVVVSPVVSATYDAGTDPVPKLAPHLPAIEAAMGKAEKDNSVPHVGVGCRIWCREAHMHTPDPATGLFRPDIATEQREAWTGRRFCLACCEMVEAPRTTTWTCPRCKHEHVDAAPPTHAAMLGEAHALFRRMCTFIIRAHDASGGTGETRKALIPHFNAFGNWLVGLKRDAEARAMGPDGTTCPTCGREFPSTSVRDAHQATAHVKCGLCGGMIGPDITGRPMCYRCGPEEMTPYGA